jgi:hypothetical protein
MTYHVLADLVVAVHAVFVAFVVLGGFLAWRWRRLVMLHLPAAAWGALIEFAGWICPLTPLENALRLRAGHAGYTGGFIEHYLLSIMYPDDLTRTVQIVLGAVVVAVNAVAYGVLFVRAKRSR